MQNISKLYVPLSFVAITSNVRFCYTGKGIEKAEGALKKLGAVEPLDPGHKGSWAFAGFKGPHHTKNWVTQVTRPRYHGPAMVADMINTPAADQG